MPFRPSLRSVWTLIILAVVTYSLFLWCENSRVQVKKSFYDEKVTASHLMDRALRSYQETNIEKGVFDENYKDPRLDAIIGQQYSVITTENGMFETEVIGANPNFAAIAVDLLCQAGLKKGDWVAVAFTGSHPGVNTAVLSACEAMGVTPVTITAIGASWWGASDPDFTWLDMETLLNKRGVVHSIQAGASYGGINDMGIGLSEAGRQAMQAAIERNNVQLIHEDNLPASVAKRMDLYTKAAAGHTYKAYVNVGDGIASLGHIENGKLIGNGYNQHLPLQNYPARGVVHLFNTSGAAIINFHDIPALSRAYGLGGAHVPLPAVGDGDVYITERYNLIIAGISAVLSILLIVVLVRMDARLFKLQDDGVDPDTLV